MEDNKIVQVNMLLYDCIKKEVLKKFLKSKTMRYYMYMHTITIGMMDLKFPRKYFQIKSVS